MRKRGICAPMIILCLLLSACGGGDRGNTDELALEIRASYIAMTTCNARMDVTADYGQRVYKYTLDFSYEKGGDTTVTVVSPEEAAGVTARITGDSTLLEYDGVSLETGPLDESGLSPISAAPALLRSAAEGFIAESGMEMVGERECLFITCRDPEGRPGQGTEFTLWFDAGTHELVQGEILADGVRIISCTFTEFSMT